MVYDWIKSIFIIFFLYKYYHSLTNQTEESIEKGNKQKMPENEIIFL